MKPKAIIVDIDGTILDTDILFEEMYEKGIKKADRMKYFYEHCNSERIKAKPDVRQFINTIIHATYEVKGDNNLIGIDSVTLILSTGRDEKCLKETDEKLYKQGIEAYRIYMRKQGDNRPSAEVKKEHIEKIQKEFDIIAFIDDDLSNCEMAKSMGILALRVV